MRSKIVTSKGMTVKLELDGVSRTVFFDFRDVYNRILNIVSIGNGFLYVQRDLPVNTEFRLQRLTGSVDESESLSQLE